MSTLQPLTFHHTFKSGRTISLLVQRIAGAIPKITASRRVDVSELKEYRDWVAIVVNEINSTMTIEELCAAAEYALKNKPKECDGLIQSALNQNPRL